jgi:UDP-N-acetylmuramyl pentapeptide phosphotransferase/UDP-N-acetylglucosamine-1-phosphate transferase
MSLDSDKSGPQKFHSKVVPRIGGISIALGLFASEIIRLKNLPHQSPELFLVICAIPAFAIGLAEDLTKKIGVRVRLFFIAISGMLFIHLLNTQITQIGIPFLDSMFLLPLVSILFTIFAITGLANSYNIIDGFNGLSSMVGIFSLLAITYLGIKFSDTLVTNLSIAMISAILGFFIWNYPRGLIFLGDGGAYLIGYWVATLSILIVSRHLEISPWFAVLINGYPIFETLFTIYRRKFHKNRGIGQPDGMHFHSLVYRRAITNKNKNGDWISANSRTAPYLWIMSIISIAPGVLWYQSTITLLAAFLIYAVIYLWIYYKIVKFNVPNWLF